MSSLKQGVFIIESNHFEDENDRDREGILLRELLQLIGVEVEYYYIRTFKELEYILDVFRKSDYKYLHIACHGCSQSFQLTLLENVTFKKFSKILGKVHKRRLFISACSTVNDGLKEALKDSGLISIIGPNTDVGFHDAAIFWTSFYRLIFKESDEVIPNGKIEENIKSLSPLFDVPITAYFKYKNKLNYRMAVFNNDTNNVI